MEETLSEIRRLVGGHVPSSEELARQKVAVLNQREPRFVLMEGLKLLSLCIELDSCLANACIHNTESLSVEMILYNNNILCPSLPTIVPDGYKLKGNILVLLECFVRSNPANFQQKYTEDLVKLESIKGDLLRSGVQLIPIVDGRTNFGTTLIPDWVCERLRHLFFKLMEYQQESNSAFEESEYQRLCEALSQNVSKLSGLDSINTLRDCRAEHFNSLLRKCHEGIQSDMKGVSIRESIELMFQSFRNKLKAGSIKAQFVRVSQQSLLNSFNNLYIDELGDTLESYEQLRDSFKNISPIIKFLYLNPETQEVTKQADIDNIVSRLKSLLNKVKSMKAFNTRRKLLLIFDTIILMGHVKYHKEKGKFLDQEWLGSSFCSVNDRLVSLQETIRSLSVWVERRYRNMVDKSGTSSVLSKGVVFKGLIQKTLEKIQLVLESVNLSIDSYGVNIKDIDVGYDELLKCQKEGVQPTMHYNATCPKEFPYKLSKMSCDSGDDFKMLSSLCLSVVNSMKTSSVPKLRHNETGKNRYEVVTCREAFYQDIKTPKGEFKLIYQKTGEGPKCYAINDNTVGEVCSFYADPKRYFLPIFSSDVLTETIKVMLSWLTDCSELSEQMVEVGWLVKAIVVLVLCHPTKRSQRFLQNIRYFIMAFISEYHHIKLMEKLKEQLITKPEYLLYSLVRRLLNIILSESVKSMLTNRFKFILNVSYFCHLITKETPDRLTDQIKCFEKFLEPKLAFGSCIVNPKELSAPEELDDFYYGADKFLEKPSPLDPAETIYGRPGVNKRLFSMMVSAFNAGLLFKGGEVKGNFVDPMVNSGCATALDLASNKSVVINKYLDGERILEYDINKLTSAAVCQLTEVFSRKGKYLLNRNDYDYKVQRVIAKLVLGESNKKSRLKPAMSETGYEDYECLFSHEQQGFFEEVKRRVDSVLCSYKPPNEGHLGPEDQGEPSLTDLRLVISNDLHRKLICSELSTHVVEEFDHSLFPESFYYEVCEKVHGHQVLKDKYFYDLSGGPCPISQISKSVASHFYENGDYFQCFKSILLQMGANKVSGKFMHHKHRMVNFKLDHSKLMDDVRISERESNSEALSKALSLSNCTSSALKNLCFYSEESPESFTSLGPDTGRLKFSLSYKEQVGGNRELYIGDLRTKMYTRLIEDYFEAFTRQFRGSCLNDEKEFENALVSMRLNVSLAYLSYSIDHSKWGPMMCPFLFLMLSQNLEMKSPAALEGIKSRDLISTLLCWHIHKMVEVPINVVTALMKSYIKRNLGIMKSDHITPTEAFFFNEFEIGNVPSHISSILDMGQGILHNASDLYGLITEKFINFCVSQVSNGLVDSYTSSDDQISMFDGELTEMFDNHPEEFHIILEFHNYLSDRLNKFVSPKSVIGKYVAEFKSRFFVWGEEVPLLTKFVAASLHNVKCKEPHQLVETIDTIIDQSVANGVPVSLCNKIQERTLQILRYAKYPIDPFLLLTNSDVKDWVDGNRGYRVMRNIEAICPESTRKVRLMLRRLYNKLKLGELHEEFTAMYLSSKPRASINNLMKLVCDEFLSDEELSYCWLNFSTHFPIRMVLRQKVVYPSVLNVEEEKIPTIIKTLQNKLSSNFTRGAQKLLSEAINKSAFQSSIASGFIGLCKTLGSKCVRDQDRGVHYIRSILNNLEQMSDVEHLVVKGCDIWKYSTLDDVNSDRWETTLLRPLLWDYLCIALSTALEIGPWVLGDPKPKLEVKLKNTRNCDYFLLKPQNTRILEDRVSMNHLIHSVRRLYPEVFEKHLLPYMSDLASVKMKWSPRIKFLDLCVVLDVNCEALSLISHVVKWKRTEHYVVLMSELQNSHERHHASLVDERVVTTLEVMDNFMKQIYFESYMRPFVVTTRTIGSFTWFPHKTSIHEGEGLERLGPFASFVEKVISKGIERPMYEYDMQSGYTWVDISVSPSVIATAELVRVGMVERERYHDFWDFWQELLTRISEGLRVLKTIKVSIKSSGGNVTKQFMIHLLFTGNYDPVTENLSLVLQEATYSGSTDTTYLESIWGLILTDPNFSTRCVKWFFSTDTMSDLLIRTQTLEDQVLIDVDLDRESMKITGYDFTRVGPDWEPVPLVMREGALWEGDRKVKDISVELRTQDIRVFVDELSEDHLDVMKQSLGKILQHLERQNASLTNIDVLEVFTLKYGDHLGLEILTDVMSQTEGWFSFRGATICYSKSRDCLMKHVPGGRLRLRGKLCEPLRVEIEPVEDIE
uniref:RNA-directed RNA polymerase L n=1 Tax=Arenavirus sp. TaxID=41118 RepID=A0A858HU60_9VIRU|nr:RNA-dependent RNA polymerase [Arenavirus sp.]